MAEHELTIVVRAKDLASRTLKSTQQSLKGLSQLGASKGFKAFAQGVGMGAGIAAFNLMGSAVGAVTGFLGDSIRAAIEEEQSIAKLTSSLKANVPAWNGQTKAIEDVLRSRMKLGFSDDEQRQSLSILVAATHNVNDALALQSTAMDLARLKGISLADASDALTRVEAGSYRVLKSLGIVLKDGATQQDALAAVQKVAAGQAEAYANTTGGKLLTAQVQINEAMEHLGTAILPIVAESLKTVSRGFDSSTVSIEDMRRAAARGSQAAQARLNALGDAGKAVGVGMHVLRDGIVLTDHSLANLKNAALAARAAQRALATTMADSARTFLSQYFDPIIARDNLLTNVTEVNAAKRVLADKNASTAEKREATARLHQLSKDNLELKIGLAEAGALSRKETAKLLADLQKKAAGASGEARRAIQRVINKLKELAAFQVRINIHTVGVGSTVHKGEKLQAGGPALPHHVYTVGEKGPEKLVMGSQGGTVIPNGGGMGATNVTVVVKPVVDVDAKVSVRDLLHNEAFFKAAVTHL